MNALAPVLLQAMGHDHAASAAIDLGDLEARLAATISRATAALDDIALDPVRFVTHIGTQLAAEGVAPDQIVHSLHRLHAADLYLAAACLASHARAVARFEHEHIASIDAFVARYITAPALLDELKQRLRIRLLVGGDRPPQLGGYRGRGPLGGWMRVVATRAAIDLVREGATGQVELREPADLERDPELGLLKARYAPIFARVFAAVLAALPSRDRTMLRLYFVEDMTLAAIGRAFDVQPSTVQRTLVRVREQILEDTLGALGEELGMDPDQAHSIVLLVQSRVDLELRAHLTTPIPS